MAAKLAFDKSISREMQLRILTEPVVVTMNNDGITVAAKRHKGVTITWGELLDHCRTPDNVPAKFHQQAFQYLVSCQK